MNGRKEVISDLNVAKIILCNTKMLTPEMCLRIGRVITSAIALLKEQEPVKPTWSQGKAYCGKCGQRLPRKRSDKEINYCGYCGQKVKWDDN